MLLLQAHSAQEVEDFVKIASALLVNVGTLTSDWTDGMMLAGQLPVAMLLPMTLECPASQTCPAPAPHIALADAVPCRTAKAANANHKPWVLDPVGELCMLPASAGRVRSALLPPHALFAQGRGPRRTGAR